VSKRKRKSRSARKAARSMDQEPQAAAPKKAEPARPSSEFSPDYSFIVKDLRRIGVLAGSFLLLLVALSFFLR
jgi:hypothetical protein